jgi:hypothetical protein
LELKWLEGQDAVNKLNPILQVRNWTLLNPATCRALVAEEDGEVKGFCVLQMFPMVGPFESQDPSVTLPLVREMKDFLDRVGARGYLVIADSEWTKKICEYQDLQKVESPVFLGVGKAA